MEGYSNSYLMHGILALAALHRACLYPAQKEKYIKASAFHQAAGLKEFRELITSPIDPSNWQPVFCFASMIMVYVCASPIRLGADRWPAPISNVVELFSIVNGLQTIMAPWLHSLGKTQLAPLVNCIWLDDDMLIPRYFVFPFYCIIFRQINPFKSLGHATIITPSRYLGPDISTPPIH